MKRLLGSLALATLTACGLVKINVNGKEHTLGQSEPAQAASSSPEATSSDSSASAANKAAVADVNRTVQTLVVDTSLTDTPRVVQAKGVAMDGKFSKVVDAKGWPDCGTDMPSKPVVVLDIQQAPSPTFTIALAGGANDGFVVVRADHYYWTTCTQTSGETPAMGPPQGGWQPGKYEIYPLARSARVADYTVEAFDPAKPTPWSDKVKKVKIGKKLDKPMFVEVALQPERVKLREQHAGQGCRTALPTQPDLALDLERPIPNLAIRPLYTPAKVELRVQTPQQGQHKGSKYCAGYQRAVVANDYAPTYESPAEAHLAHDAEGTYGISLGSADAKVEKVTLMIFDPSTKWSPLEGLAPPDELPLEQRELAPFYPQLDVRTASLRDHGGEELVSKLFATAPKQLFAYAKLDFDADVAQLASNAVDKIAWPKKNEPFLVLDVNGEQARVLAADGAEYRVKLSHLLAKPDGTAALPASPRPLRKDLRFEQVRDLAPASAKPLLAGLEAREKKYQACADRAWAPYAKQLNGATWTIRSNTFGDPDVKVESPRAQKIRDAGNTAVDKACGTEAQLDKDSEGTRVKLLAEVEKDRAKLLAAARKRSF